MRTLEDLALDIVQFGPIQDLRAATRRAALMVTFWRWDDGPRRQMAFSEPEELWKRLANTGLASVEISDGRGGVRAREPELA